MSHRRVARTVGTGGMVTELQQERLARGRRPRLSPFEEWMEKARDTNQNENNIRREERGTERDRLDKRKRGSEEGGEEEREKWANDYWYQL